MAVFLVAALDQPEKLGVAINRQYGANHFRLTPSIWLVPDEGSTKGIADKLGITDNAVGATAVVFLFTAYSGFGPQAAWTWLQQIGSAVPNG